MKAYAFTNILPESRSSLDSICMFLKEHPEIKSIEIGVHLAIWSDVYSYKLTKARADNLTEYLIKRRIDKSKIIAIGYEDTKNIVPLKEKMSESDWGLFHKVNNRVEFRIIEVNN